MSEHETSHPKEQPATAESEFKQSLGLGAFAISMSGVAVHNIAKNGIEDPTGYGPLPIAVITGSLAMNSLKRSRKLQQNNET